MIANPPERLTEDGHIRRYGIYNEGGIFTYTRNQ